MTAAPRTAAGLYDLMQREGMNPSGPRPKERKRRDNAESRMQQALIRYWSNRAPYYKLHEFLLFKISNDGLRSPAMGAIMKREGLRAGCPDLMLAVRRGAYAGLFLELKKPDGRVAPAQAGFLAELTRQGYLARVAYSYEQAVAELENYLEL